jgi:hypothetical protein
MFRDYIKKLKVYAIKATRSRAAKQIERAYNRGELKDGDIIKVTFEKPSFLKRHLLWNEEDRFFFNAGDYPASNTGKVVSTKTDPGIPYVRLDDVDSGFTIDPSYDKWGKK